MAQVENRSKFNQKVNRSLVPERQFGYATDYGFGAFGVSARR
jgi:hypothetical protein